jgi:trimeric autotransporter adhesin
MIRCLRSAIRTRRAPASVVGALVAVMALGTVMVQPLYAVVQPKGSPLADKIFRNPSLHIMNLERNVADLGARVPAAVMARQLGTLRADSGLYDPRGGRWSSLVLSEPLVAGDGKGNTIAGTRPPSEADVWQAVKGFVTRHYGELNVDVAELASPSIGIFEKGNLIHVHAPRVVRGIAVRDSGLTAVINHGNLILFGLQNWGAVDASISPALSLAEAKALVAAHVKPFAVTGYNDTGRLERVPLARGADVADVTLGRGYEYRLAWVISPQVVGDLGTYEALVDALTGELLAFQDKNLYAARRIVGGVYPVSNDQIPPDGVEQPGWPMPFANVIGSVNSFTTASGQLTVCEPGNIQTTLNGQFVRIADQCGAINENSAAGDMDLGVSGGDDCTIPAGHSAGDTHSARTGFYELNRIKEQARGYLPGNAWLNAQLTSNMNINNTCNAFWNGSTVNFYRSGGGCGNTGEIAAVFDHEWGHGMDDNGTTGTISSPGEAIADIYGVLRLNNSCMGRGFFLAGNCSGYGDPCLSCDGVRELDFAKHASGLPHGITWILSNCSAGGQTGPCNRETHCEGMVPAEAGWDLQFRDLRAAPFNYDENTALELTTRLMFLGAQTLTSWYTCGAGCAAAGTCGCGATGGYLLTLGTDDDNGNLADGTPHMQAIRSAFERHQIHCSTQPVINAGCAGGPTTAPVVTAVPTLPPGPGDAIDVSWNAVPGAASYAVYRTEGVNGCSFGKVKVGETANLTFTETGLLDTRTYLYSVLPIGANPSCLGLMSNCAATVPSPADDPCVPVELQSFEIE